MSVLTREATVRHDGVPAPSEMNANRADRPSIVSNVILGVVGIAFAIPLVWLVLASVDSHASWAISWPHFTLSNFTYALSQGRAHSLWVSTELAVIATVVATVTGTMAAYALSRRHIPWKGPMLLFVLFLSGVPINLIIIPVYQAFTDLGWLTIVPTAIFLGITSLPFEIWIIKNFIDAVPGELEEVARVEGASTFSILTRIVAPMAAPGIGAAAVFGFINAWGSFLVPLVLISNSNEQPGAVAVYAFITASAIRYGGIAAFSVLYAIPVVVLYALMGRLFQGGFVQGGALRG